jgi:uncharacterized SAM-binding protein YcdF (DUF218 family)
MPLMSSSLQSDAVIVIFGAAVRRDGRPSATMRRRVDAAATFGRRFARPLYIPTGAVGRYGASEALVMATLLQGWSVPSDCIHLEETGTDTLSSVRAVRHVLRSMPLGIPVYAATSGFHLPRCVLLLRLAGVPAHRAPPPPYPAASNWIARAYWIIREAAALPYDVALLVGLRLLKCV